MAGSVRKKGNRWYYSFEASNVDGKRKRIERSGGRTKKEAEKALRDALTEYENAGLHFDVSEVSVSDYMDYWMREHVEINCKYNTIQAYKNIIDNHIKPTLGKYKLKALTPAVLQEFINKKHLSGFSKNYISNIMTVLSGSIKAAVHPYKFIKQSPMAYVKMPKIEHTKHDTDRKVLSSDEYNRIITRFAQRSSFYIPLQIAYHTGARAGEVCGLTWDRVDLEKRIIIINRITLKKEKQWYFGTTKTKGSTREIPIGDSLVAILKKHRKFQKENRLKYGTFYTDYYVDKNSRFYGMDKTTVQPIDETVNFVCTMENGTLVTPESIKYCSRVINYELGIQFNFHALRHYVESFIMVS
jgi:integrase